MPRTATPVTDLIPAYIASARQAGYNQDTLTRAECLDIREKTGASLPRWLMKDDSRRVSKGVYSIPELVSDSTSPAPTTEPAHTESVEEDVNTPESTDESRWAADEPAFAEN